MYCPLFKSPIGSIDMFPSKALNSEFDQNYIFFDWNQESNANLIAMPKIESSWSWKCIFVLALKGL